MLKLQLASEIQLFEEIAFLFFLSFSAILKVFSVLFHHLLPVEGLVVLEVLPERLQEESELPELEVIGPVLVLPLRLVLGEVEGAMDGGLAVEELLALQDPDDAEVHLEKEVEVKLCFYIY